MISSRRHVYTTNQLLLLYNSPLVLIPSSLSSPDIKEIVSLVSQVPVQLSGLNLEGRFSDIMGLPPPCPDGLVYIPLEVWNKIFDYGCRFHMSLTCKWFYNLSWDTLSSISFSPQIPLHLVTRTLSYCSPYSLKKLSLKTCRIVNKDIPRLVIFTNLKKLDLSYCKRVDERGFLTMGPVFKNLVHLDVGGCLMNDRSMEVLGQSKMLKVLKMEFSLVTNKGMGVLRKLTKLEVLEIMCCDVDEKGLENISNLIHMQTLDISSCKVSTLQFLQFLTNLQHLNLSSCSVLTKFGSMVNLENLTSLNLSQTQVNDEGLSFLKHLTKLTSLNLSYSTNITGHGLQHLDQLYNLQKLVLRNSTIPKFSTGLSFIKYSFPHIKQLDCAFTNMTNQGLLHINSWIEIEQLDLSHCVRVTDEGLSFLESFLFPKSINISWCPVSDVGLVSLAQHVSLEELSLEGCEVTDFGLEHIWGLSNLKSLNLKSNCNISEKGMLKLLVQLPKLKIQ